MYSVGSKTYTMCEGSNNHSLLFCFRQHSATNAYQRLETNLSISTEETNFSRLANITSSESILVFAELNNTPGDDKTVDIRLTSGSEASNYTNLFDLDTVGVENYQRIDESNITKIFYYTVRNLWYNGTVNWNFSEPNIVNSTTLANNATVLVMIQHNYSQGDKKPTFNAYYDDYTSTVTDAFVIRPIALLSLSVLKEGSSPLAEFIIKNNMNTTQNVSWKYDTGILNITNFTNVNNTILVYVSWNESRAGVSKNIAMVNTSNYQDNKTGAVVS